MATFTELSFVFGSTLTAAKMTQLFDNASWARLSSITAADDATIDIQADIDATYALYMILMEGIIPATDLADFEMGLYENGVLNTGATDYKNAISAFSGASFAVTAGSQAEFVLADNLGTTAGEQYDGRVFLHNPFSGDVDKIITCVGHGIDAGLANSYVGGGTLANAGSSDNVDGVQFKMSTGNIEAGVFTLFGFDRG